MSHFFDTTCDKSPACDGLEAPWYLPAIYKKKDVFEEFARWCGFDASRAAPISKNYFCKLWKKHFSRVKIPKKNRFSRCARCVRSACVGRAEAGTSILVGFASVSDAARQTFLLSTA
jgi:hypothetical protein